VKNKGNDIYALRTLEFVERLQPLRTYEEICAHILKEMEWFGFSCVTSFTVPAAGQTLKNCLWMNNRPQDYIDRYSEKNYILHDPVVTEFRRNIHPYSWSDIRARRDLKKNEKAIIDEAREWGARDGFMVPIVTRSGSISGFCPCGFEPNLSSRARAALEIIAIYSDHALRRALRDVQRAEIAHTPLTPREREIMQWVAAGKTDDEIGEILTLGTSTVASHIENAKRKLDTFRRTHAVAQAIRLGEISL
jgi:LuxR family transcriptional regulator, quorum-sensing system regulator BjaR1